MNIKCTNCNATFAVDDAKVKNKKFSFTCPKCGSGNIFDNRPSEPEPAPETADFAAFENETDLPPTIDSGDGVPSFDDVALPDDEASAIIDSIPSFDDAEPAVAEGDNATVEFPGLDDVLNEDVASASIDLTPPEETGAAASDDNLSALMSDGEADAPIEFPSITGDNMSEDSDFPLFTDDAGAAMDDVKLDIASETDDFPVSNDTLDGDDFPVFDDGALQLESTPDEATAVTSAPVPSGDEDEDESITIDLNALDIDIDDSPEENKSEESTPAAKIADDDESITLDLDTLDIPVEESDVRMAGIVPDEDEKFSLDDAGLTVDDLAEDEVAAIVNSDDYLSGEEHFVSPSLNDTVFSDSHFEDDSLDSSLKDADSILNSWEIDSDIHDTQVQDNEYALPEDSDRMAKQRASEGEREVSEHGAVSYITDYGLKYSRLKAFARLLCLAPIVMIPHFIVIVIYGLVSSIVGLINQIFTLLGKQPNNDFCDVIINTLRHVVSVGGFLTGMTDEAPNYSGKSDIIYSQQLDLVHPASYSKVYAALRLSIVGIIIILLPHFICFLGVLLLSFFVFLFGQIAVLVTGKLPYIFFKLLVRYHGYAARILTFAFGVVDRYPRFRF